jgi:hypothetical protein
MKIQEFLEHHGIAGNPFAEEDAQNDTVFKRTCLETTFHPSWDKIYGDPSDPSTSIVFGEKGAGKTALKLQMVRQFDRHNTAAPDRRTFVVLYDDFNPFLDRFVSRVGPSRPVEKVLAQWKLWDHIDAILTLAVTQLVSRINAGEIPAARLPATQARDLALLAACGQGGDTAGENANLGVPGRQAQRVGGDLELVLRVRAAAGDDGLQLSLLSGQRVKVGIRLAVGGVHGFKACLGCEHITHTGFHAFTHSVRVIELGFLRQVADVQVGHGHGLALDLGVQTGHDLEQGGLARAIGAQHADLGAREKAQRHILQNLTLGWNGLADLVHGENVLGHGVCKLV